MDDKSEIGIPKGPPWWRSTRYLIVVLATIGYANFFFQRVNLSMAIVCMVNHTAVDILTLEAEGKILIKKNISIDDVNYQMLETTIADGDNHSSWKGQTTRLNVEKNTRSYASLQQGRCSKENMTWAKKEDGELVWPKETQGIILGGLYWGYLLFQLPAQRIIQAFGGTRVAVSSVAALSAFSMLAPITARASPWALLVIRIIQGIASALGVPAIYSMWGQWAPLEERTTLLGIVFSGSMLANAVVLPTSSLLCQYGFADGWPSVFYVYGIVGFVWCFFWLGFVSETPENHRWIHPDEKEFIMSSISKAGNRKHKGSIPWMKIFQSLPVWAIVIAQLGYNWQFFLLLAVLPLYMKEILQFDIQSNGVYSMMPYIALFTITNLWAVFCGHLMSKKIMSVRKVRKMSQLLGCIVPAILYIIVSFLDCTNAGLAVILMTCAIGVSGTSLQGYLMNPYDVAPRYATAVLSLSNTVAVAAGIIAPYVVSAMTLDKTREQWQSVYFLTVGIAVLCTAFYMLFGSGEEMDWAKGDKLELEIKINAPES